MNNNGAKWSIMQRGSIVKPQYLKNLRDILKDKEKLKRITERAF